MRLVSRLTIALALTLALAGCGPKAATPVEAVDGLLTLRAEGETSARAYRVYLPSDELAKGMASDTKSTKAQGRPTPDWNKPILQAEGTSTAIVRVVWKSTQGFPEWPPVTVFGVQKIDGGWRVIDAQIASQAATDTP